MSLPKSPTRRVALLSSASLVAATVAAAASLGFTLTPGAAMAQAVCSETQAEVSDAAADTVTCTAGTYPTGINYTTAGDMILTVVGAQTTSPTVSNFGTGGIVAIAPAAPANTDDVTLRFTGNTTSNGLTYSTAFPALLNAESRTGDVLVEIDIVRTNGVTATGISATNAVTTRAVRAVSTAGGDVTVRNLSSGTLVGTTPGRRNASISVSGATNSVAVEATSIGGGNVAIDLGPQPAGAPNGGTANGRLHGILAQVDGAGTVSITGSATASTSVAGSAGLRVNAGTGAVTVQDSGSPFSGRTGAYFDADGNVTFSGQATGADYGIDVANVAAGTTTTLNLVGGNAGGTGTTGGIAAIRAQGAGTLLINVLSSQKNMNFDVAGMSAPVDVAIKGSGIWRAETSATVSMTNFSINVEGDGAMASGVQSSGSALESPIVLTFSDPAASLNNAGWLVVGPGNPSGGADDAHEAELRLVSLEEFRHSGSIVMGTMSSFGGTGPGSLLIDNVWVNSTDGVPDDMLVFQDGTWIGEGGNIIFDVNTNATQTNCTRAPTTHEFSAADCVRIVNSTVEGVTYIDVRQPAAGDRGRLTQQMMEEGILLIETPGSTVTAENFAFDPDLPGYNPVTGNLDRGLFQFALLFDEEAEQFKIFSALTGAAYQLPMAATAAHNMWRVSTGSWLNRQADLRGSMPEELGGGIWLRASGEQTDREISTVSTLGGLPFTTDSTHRQDTYAINGGVDIFSGSDGNLGYVVGLTAGYAHTDVEYETSTNTQAMDAWTGGIYGGLVVGQLFVDAVVNANNVIIDTDAPGFNFTPEGTILSSRMISLGGQVEAGYRLLFPSGFFAEPLAGVSYVRSKIDELEILPDDPARPGLEVSYEDPSSFRAGVGARFGVDSEYAGMRTQVSLLARTWQDLEGQNTAVIHNLAFPDDPEINVLDEFSDQSNEVAVGASLWAPNGVVSGFLNLGTKFGEDYEARTGSMGVRVAW